MALPLASRPSASALRCSNKRAHRITNSIIRSLLFSLFLTIALGENTPSYLFETIGIADGLSQNSVTCIAKDKYGFIWFGTEDGLNRYDGISFKSFRHDPLDSNTINSNTITSSLVDSQGNLWIGTFVSGLNRYVYETESFVHYPYNPEDSLTIGKGTIQALHEDGEGNIWIGTSKSGLYRLNPNTGDSHPLNSLISNNATLSDSIVNSLFEDHENRLWIPTTNGLNVLNLNNYELKSFLSNTDDPNSIFDNYVNYVFESFDGIDYHLWIGTNWGGFDLYNARLENFTHFGYQSPTNPDYPETGTIGIMINCGLELTQKVF